MKTNKPLAKITLRRNLCQFWNSISGFVGEDQISICDRGLQKFIHIPKEAKFLYITAYNQPPRKLSNVLKFGPTIKRAAQMEKYTKRRQYLPEHIHRKLFDLGFPYLQFEWS